MDDAIGGAVGYAIGIAASPIPIVALILMLFSTRPRLNSVVFTSTWIAGIGAVAVIVAFVPGFELDESPSDTRGWFRLGVGVVFILLGVRNWRRRPAPGEEPTMPPWLRSEDGLGLRSAIGLGIVLSVLNPKDATLAAAGGAAIGSRDLGGGETIVVAAVFTAIAASTVLLPLVAYLVVGARLDGTLHAAKAWLIKHNAAVLAVIWVVLGGTFLFDGASVLTS